MASTIRTLLDNDLHHIVYVSQNADTSAEVVVDVSALAPACTSVVIEEIWYTVSGVAATLLFDAGTDDIAFRFGYNGAAADSNHFDFRGFGGLKDPLSSTPVGDILFTSATFAAGDVCDFVLKVRKVGVSRPHK